MTVEFSENIKSDLRDFMLSFPMYFRDLNAGRQIETFNHLKLRITDNNEFQCEIAFNNTILISETTIEIIWCLTYAHLLYYNLFCKGTKPDGQIMTLQSENWEVPKEMIKSAVNGLSSKSDFCFAENFPRNFYNDNEFGKIFKYSLLLFLSHELFHVKWNGKFKDSLTEENNCDIDALRLILNSADDSDYLAKSKGVCLGLMILNIYGIHTSNFDGITHPYTYDRLINNLELFFGKESDKIWGFSVAIFALHMTEKEIKQPKNEFDNFFDCVIAYKEILENKNGSH
ncbi:hypothetical protein C9994_13465 [Marivirga lumbricoides]|uniref:Peptidase U49 n=1 Tax=Marivirga lumbricoides TaxID=1046115 RepID=A0A2T4DGG6_9BACT|nr:hypothetical protein C9994_13465 [Marivirga lumbricoides]